MKKLLSLFLMSCTLWAQSYNPQYNYKEIKEENIRIVYPQDMKENANEVLSFIGHQNKNNTKSVEGQGKEFVIILHKDTTVSNGFVTAGPFRGEFFGTSPLSSYELGATPWFQTLAVHEYRHALQMMHGREGTLNKILYFLGGESSVALANVLAIPRWYWEGDAVSMETALSNGGRGRLNYFLKEYRQKFLDNEEFLSYEKAKNGSYKDKVPNYYLLGYLITAYGREVYGYDFWKDIFTSSVNYYGFPPLSKALKKQTGMNSEDFYYEAMKWWKNKWSSEEENYESYENISIKNEIPKDYLGAYKYKDKYLSLKKSYSQIDSFILIDSNGQEEKLIDKSISYSDNYDYNRGFIAWDQYSSHKTNPMIDYSTIALYDIEKGKLSTISKESKYFSPNIANSKDQIVLIQTYEPKDNSIVIINFQGEIIKEFENENYFFNNPVWSTDDSRIISSARNNKGEMALVSVDIEKEKVEELIPFGNYIIENIWLNEKSIYFSGTFDYIDNIYSFDMTDKKIKKLSNCRYGAYRPSVIDNFIVFSEYENGNYVLKKKTKDNDYNFTLKTLKEQENFKFDFFDKEGGDISQKVKLKSYGEKDYSSLKNLINFHTWLYSYSEDELYLNLISTNETTDFNLNLLYIHDFRKDKNLFSIGGSFIRYWPDASLFYEKDDRNLKNDEEIEFNIAFPINLTEGLYYRSIKPSISYLYNKDDFINLNSYKLSLLLSNMKKRAYMNLVSKNSQEIELNYTESLDKKASKFSLDSYFTFGAFGQNDYTKLGLAYEVEDSANDYKYSDTFIFPRGYDDIKNDNIFKVSFDYGLPLFYPENGIDGLYIKRIRSNLFYDYSKYEINDKYKKIDSIGVEVYFDTSVLSLIDLSIGIRYSYKLDDKEEQIDVVIPLQSF